MNKLFAIILVALICSVFTIFPPFFAEASVQAERPVFTIGDYWIYERPNKGNLRREFIGMEGDNYVFRINKRRVVFDKNLLVVNHTFQEISFPLFVGKHWSHEIDKYDPNWGSYRILCRYNVDAFEEVETPAGKFRSYKITREMVLPGSMQYLGGEKTLWYSPEVGQVIKSSWGTLLEFKRQEPNRQ